MKNYVKKQPLQSYYREKIRLLSDFGIKITTKIRTELKACTNEIQMDNICKTIIINNL